VVLVRPHYAGNVGAAARVMANFGLSDLYLIDPVATPRDEEARRLSTHGQAILDNVLVKKSLEESVADCAMVVATSANSSGLVRGTSAISVRDLIPHLVGTMGSAPVAIVFGPEPSGLTNAEICRCHHLMHIPANPDYPALNLAQAVAICLYELHQATTGETHGATTSRPQASFMDQERMFDHLQHGLKAIHFLYDERADGLMHALRHLIGRAQPDETEVKMLHGLARQMEWVAAHLPAGCFEQTKEAQGPK